MQKYHIQTAPAQFVCMDCTPMTMVMCKEHIEAHDTFSPLHTIHRREPDGVLTPLPPPAFSLRADGSCLLDGVRKLDRCDMI